MTLAAPRWNLRLFVVSFAAVAISLPIAWASIAKLLLVFACLAEIGREVWKRAHRPELQTLSLARFVPWLIPLMYVSLLWTSADLETACQSLVKHGKLVFMLIPAVLIRNPAEARTALQVFAAGQIILLSSSWLVFFGVPLPWVIYTGGKNAVFSTYLDQSMILATSAAVFWHLRNTGIWPRALAWLCVVAAVANVMFLLEGRTGYVLVVGLAGLAFAWACPPRWRKPLYGLTAVLVLVSVGLAYLYAQRAPDPHDPQARTFIEPGRTLSSDAWRLNAWRRSLQAIEQTPVLGTGVGSWKSAIQPFVEAHFEENFGTSPISNPHQEYLLWMVEFGALGCIALLASLLLAARDARHFDPEVARALWSLLAACAVAGMFNSVLYDDSIGDFFCIGAGLLLALGMHGPKFKTITP